ncbi:MAG: RNase adapter RapZ [Eubacteriales bacterium]|nr:RNase adapter RapZ [Eubacteriales bacterium]MDY3333069.1 RNase adapter RapZ [Gallibacter sp.]
MELLIVTGMSGAGKSQAIDCLEDQGYYCIDNMPFALVRNFIDLSVENGDKLRKAAIVVDIRGAEFNTDWVEQLKSIRDRGIYYRVLFLEADTEVLIRRFSETRRVHPKSKQAVKVSDIEQEREFLAEIRDYADFVIDTSRMKGAQLKNELIKVLSEELVEETFVVNVMSFGFKHGIPINADMVFDMRFIKNPYYLSSLKKLTGNNKKIRDYVTSSIEAKRFIKNLSKLINDIIPCYQREGKFNINLAFGCTGGQHRSVAMANEFYDLFKKQEKQVTLEHRDIKKK